MEGKYTQINNNQSNWLKSVITNLGWFESSIDGWNPKSTSEAESCNSFSRPIPNQPVLFGSWSRTQRWCRMQLTKRMQWNTSANYSSQQTNYEQIVIKKNHQQNNVNLFGLVFLVTKKTPTETENLISQKPMWDYTSYKQCLGQNHSDKHRRKHLLEPMTNRQVHKHHRKHSLEFMTKHKFYRLIPSTVGKSGSVQPGHVS